MAPTPDRDLVGAVSPRRDHRLFASFIPPVRHAVRAMAWDRLAYPAARAYERTTRFVRHRTVRLQLLGLRLRASAIAVPPSAGPWVRLDALGLAPERRAGLRVRPRIGDVGRHGELRSLVGPIRGWKAADDDFGTRRRHDVELVAYGEYVAVQKRFRANREGFVTEVTALDRLARAGCGVPPIWHVDPTTLTLIMPLVDGDSVRLLLEEAGASLGSTVATPDARLSREERRDRRAQEAAAFLDRALPPTLRETLFESLRAIHLAGVIGNDITYANILLPGRDARPIWIDFDHARWFPRRLARRLLRPLRDRDVERFDTFFGTRHLTRRRAADLIAAANREFAASLPRTSLRYGLALGNPSVARPAPLHLSDTDVRERDIVDLTPGSGSRALALLRRGARSVTAIAKDVETRAALEVVRDVAEWSDDRTYDLRLGGESELRACEEAPCDLLVADVAPSSPLAEALPAIVRLRPRSLAIACGSTDVSGSRMTSSTMNCIELAIAEAGYRLRPRRRRLELRADAEAPGHA